MPSAISAVPNPARPETKPPASAPNNSTATAIPLMILLAVAAPRSEDGGVEIGGWSVRRDAVRGRNVRLWRRRRGLLGDLYRCGLCGRRLRRPICRAGLRLIGPARRRRGCHLARA